MEWKWGFSQLILPSQGTKWMICRKIWPWTKTCCGNTEIDSLSAEPCAQVTFCGCKSQCKLWRGLFRVVIFNKKNTPKSCLQRTPETKSCNSKAFPTRCGSPVQSQPSKVAAQAPAEAPLPWQVNWTGKAPSLGSRLSHKSQHHQSKMMHMKLLLLSSLHRAVFGSLVFIKIWQCRGVCS